MVDIFKVVFLFNCKLIVCMGISENILFLIIFIYLVKLKVEIIIYVLLIFKK